MIPISSRENVSYTDPKDGIVFKFKPKSGALERQLFEIWDEKKSHTDRMDMIDSLVDMILIEPKYSDAPSKVFNSDEKGELLKFWHEANKLTGEEKKI
jgi:hypothetical protein